MTMKKKERHRLLTRLLVDEDIQKQEQFVEVLAKRGIKVTQATISRDIKELNLVKIPAVSGGYRYSMPSQTVEEDARKLDKILHKAFVSISKMDKFVYLKTIPGNASMISTLIEVQQGEHLFGLLADDDNVLMIAQTEEACEKLYQFFEQYDKNNK